MFFARASFEATNFDLVPVAARAVLPDRRLSIWTRNWDKENGLSALYIALAFPGTVTLTRLTTEGGAVSMSGEKKKEERWESASQNPRSG